MKDLGVLFDNQLTFNLHIHDIIANALRTLGILTRDAQDFRDNSANTAFFNSFIRSKLEYCSVIRCPSYNNYINPIESVQRNFLKILYYRVYKTSLDYNSCYKTFNFQSPKFKRYIWNNCIDS